MAADILLVLISKDHPERLERMITLMKAACAEPANYKLHVVIDDDQLELYGPVLEKYQLSDVSVVTHKNPGLGKCMKATMEYFLASEHYFLLALPDDIYGAIKNWDRFIVAKKKSFADDIFSLYSGASHFGRFKEICGDCYSVKKDSPYLLRPLLSGIHYNSLDLREQVNVDFFICYEYCELFPVITKKVAKYLKPIFDQSDTFLSNDIIIALFLQQIYRLSGEKRNVQAWPDNFRVVNDANTSKYIMEHSTPFDMNKMVAIAEAVCSEIRINQN